ncbi:MAG: hypothetical protein E7535_11645 [Ruminococcaceae bacterium]|nr:hypothetical protein [Oscillospiraceae bacterium]
MEYEGSVREFVNRAYESGTDVFLRMPVPELSAFASDGIKTVVFTPSSVFINTDSPFAVYDGKASAAAFLSAPDVLLSDIRFMGDSGFREFLTRKKYRRLVTLFSECSLKGEYGYRESFRWVGEYRAEITHFCQILAFFSPPCEISDELRSIFSSDDTVVIGERKLPSLSFYEAPSSAAKFYFTAAEAEKYAYKKICIYFNSRTEQNQFAGFLRKRGTPFVAVNGELTPEKYKRELMRFVDSDITILLATRSLIPSALFLPFYKVLLCGAPFSLSHLSRCENPFSSSPVFTIFCEDDFERNRKILSSFSERAEDKNIYLKGISYLSEIEKYLQNPTKESFR